jgi:hypothetical protein
MTAILAALLATAGEPLPDEPTDGHCRDASRNQRVTMPRHCLLMKDMA